MCGLPLRVVVFEFVLSAFAFVVVMVDVLESDRAVSRFQVVLSVFAFVFRDGSCCGVRPCGLPQFLTWFDSICICFRDG